MSTRLVGRQHALRELEAAWSAIDEGFRLVLLSGGQGVGKSRLATDAFQRLTAQSSATPLVARLGRESATAAFAAWAEALEGVLRWLPEEQVLDLCGSPDDLARLIRSVAAAHGHLSENPPADMHVRDALADLIARLTRTGPACLLLDDAHLADPWSWDLVRRLASHPQDHRLLIIACGSRHQLYTTSVATVLSDLEERGIARHLELGPLSVDQMGELAEHALRTKLEPRVVSALHHRTQGNPYLATRILREVLEEGGALNETLERVPPGVLDGVRAWLSRHTSLARRVSEVLAVAESPVLLDDLSQVTQQGAEDVADSVQALVAAGLVAEEQASSSWSYRLVHPVVRDAICAGLGGRRASLHRGIGRALLDRGEHLRAAGHYWQGADGAKHEAVRVLLEGLEHVERHGDYRLGLELLGMLGDLLPSGDSRWTSVAEALVGWSFSHDVGTDARLAITALREIDLVSAGQLPMARRAEIKARLAVLLAWTVGDLAAATQAAEEAVDFYETEGMESSALLARLELAYIRGLAQDIPGMADAAHGVLSVAERSKDPTALESSLSIYATATFMEGGFAEAEQAFDRAISLARRSGRPTRIARNLMHKGWALAHQGRMGEALDALELAKLATPTWPESGLADVEAGVRWLAGDVRGATACLADRDWSTVTLRRGLGLPFLALSHLELANEEGARQALGVAKSLYDGRDWFYATDRYRHAAGMLARHEGDLPRAVDLIGSAARGLLTMGAPMLAIPVLLDQAEVAYEARQADAADEAAEVLRALASRSGRPLHAAIADLAVALAMLTSDRDPDRVHEQAARAAAMLGESGLAIIHGRSLLVRGLAMIRREDDADQVVAALREAAMIFQASDALWRRDRVVAMVRERGSSGKRAMTSILGPWTLTPRELEVATLAAQRLTAREIADMLFLSPRTIETHIASVYSKLGVRSKADLAQVLEPVDHGGGPR